jgi:hypothetical protein
MIRRTIHRATAVLLLAALLSASGCSSSNPAATATPPQRPEVTAAPSKATAPPVSRFEGYSLRIKPARGTGIVLREPVAAQLIMDSLQSERLQVKEEVGKFRNKVDVLGPDDSVQYAFTLSSDGQLLMKYGDGRIFRMPEYVYYLIERSPWNYGGSLVDEPLKWQPDKGTAQLELALPRLIGTAMQPAFGYAMAYFSAYKIYGVNTSARDKVKVYLLMTYAGYDVDGNRFAPVFLHTTPATLIFAKSGADTWELTELKRPPESKEKRNLYTDVRTIFPYECMEAVMEDLGSGTPDQIKDIEQQATEYLNAVGLSGLTVES